MTLMRNNAAIFIGVSPSACCALDYTSVDASLDGGSLDKCMGHGTRDIPTLDSQGERLFNVTCHASRVPCPMHLSNDPTSNSTHVVIDSLPLLTPLSEDI